MFGDMVGSHPNGFDAMPGSPRRLGADIVVRTPGWAMAAVLVCLAGHPADAQDGRGREQPLEAGPQLRVGVLQHDLDGYGGTENGVDITVELRGAPLKAPFWNAVFSPRPHFGANLNDSGTTSSLYAGLTWMAELGAFAYISADFGGAVHDGKLQTDDPERADLGSRLLFREALEVGVRLGYRWRVGVRIDHISNANLASENDGITDLGVVVSREF